MSTEQLVGTLASSHGGLKLVLTPENCYPSMSESPDSSSSISNMSDREATGCPDNLLGCINECSLEYNYYNVKSAASNTFNVTPINSGDEAGPLNQFSSFDVSNRDSSVDDCCFMSSGEMVMRYESFFLEDLSPKVVSSSDKSSNHPAECPAEFELQAVTPPDVSEKSTERDTNKRIGLCNVMTKENNIPTSTSHRALSSESERDLLMTFNVCERSELSGKEAPVANPEAEMLPYFSGSVTPEQGKTFMFTPVMPNCVHDNQISTPVPDTEKKISRLLSFSESPCIGSANRQGPITSRQMLVTRAEKLVSRLTPSASQDHKIEVRKTELWDAKPKIVTRSWRRMAVPGSTSQHKSAQVKVNSKCTVTRRETTTRVGSPKMSVSNRHRPAVNEPVSNTIISPFKKSSVKSAQIDSKGPLKNNVSNKINIKSGPALDQVRPSVSLTQLRRSSESSSLTARPPKEKRRVSTGDATGISDNPKGHPKPWNKRVKDAVETNSSTPPTEVPKSRMLARPSKLTATAGVSRDDCKSRFQRRTTPRSQSPGGTSKPQGRRSSTSKSERTAQSKQSASASLRGMEPLHRSASAANIKPQLCGPRPPQTPSRPSLMGPLLKIPVPGSKGFTESRVHSEKGASTGKTLVSGAAVHKSTQLKSIGLKARLVSKQNTGPSLTSTCKLTATTGKGASASTVSLLKKAVSTRHGGPTSVDKTAKSKTSSHQQHPNQRAPQPKPRTTPLVVAPAAVPEKKDQSTQTDSSSKYDAVSVILQKALVEFDDAQKKCRGLSQELTDLQGELVFSVSSSECLEKEKELHEFLQAKWDKSKALMQQQMKELEASHEAMKLELQSQHEQLQCVKQQHETSLEELRKTKKDAAALSELIEDLTAKNNVLIEKLTAEEIRSKELAEKTEDDSHTLYLNKELESLKAVLDMKNKQLHEQEKKLMELSRQAEKNVTLDESPKKIQHENNDSHILYLEQELESVRVVLDIKNKQLHQLEKRVMEMDQLNEKNVTLDESLKKTQQENEHLRARMERQAALSRQLSTEQATLQEYLQKESQLNKRLSMENEELLWKLNNGDLSSPHKMSPTSTSSPISHSFTLQSPHSSSLSSSSALSPR